MTKHFQHQWRPLSKLKVLERVRATVRDRDDHKCVKCGVRRKPGEIQLNVRRLVPLTEYTVEGCVTVCKTCSGPMPRQPGLNIRSYLAAERRRPAVAAS